MSREEFCQDEAELTVRQLMRIETGASKPTLTKIQFMAQRLGLTLFQLMPDYVDVPSEYQHLKYELLRTPSYGNEDLLAQREERLSTIYELYYDELPEEEKIIMDTINSISDVYSEADAQFGRAVLSDYFSQVLQKEEYQVNDLLLLDLYFISLGNVVNGPEFSPEDFDRLVPRLLKQSETFTSDALFVLRDVLLLVANVGRRFDYHKWSLLVFEALNRLMERFHDFQKKPILNMLMWKHYLEVESDYAKAEELYHEAILFARMTKQEHLMGKLEEEWLEEKHRN